MAGKGFPLGGSGDAGDQALQDHGGLAGAGDPGDGGEAALGQTDRQRMDRMDGACGHLDGAQVKELALLRFLPDLHGGKP